MDPHNTLARGRSLSATSAGGDQSGHIKSSHSPSPARFASESSESPVGLGLGVSNQPDYSTYGANTTAHNAFLPQPPQQQTYAPSPLGDPSATYDQGFTQQLNDDNPAFGAQPNLLSTGFNGGDFTLFSPSVGDSYNNAPLFVGSDGAQASSPDTNMMAQNHNPTPPHLLNPDPNQSIPVNQSSPSYHQHQFEGRHSRNASLGPEAALLPGQIDWSQAQFHTHRRSPSEYSDVSSVAPSPHLVTQDAFDTIDQNHSPMQRPQDANLFNELNGMTTFSLSDQGARSPHMQGARSPSLSPAVSPRIIPQQLPDMNQQNFMSLQQGNNYGAPSPYMQSEAFPQLPPQQPSDGQAQMPAPPSINIDYAPAARMGNEQPRSLDVDSLTPPERGRPRGRPRAVTDPYNNSGQILGARPASSSLSPNAATDARDPSRSLSPLDRSSSAASASGRRRQSTSAVPNNVIALRLVDPTYDGPAGGGEGSRSPARVQKHPANFQCTICPKRFTRAYNLRSHLRTHTDERPFVCTVCGKAFARQHDRKRHEGLHSGEKKFVCKGELKAGGQWGCGRRFARADALGRHFRSEAGRICIKPLLDEEMLERQRVWNEQRMQAAAAQGHMVMQPAPPGMMMGGGMGDPNMGATGYPMDASGNYALPAALLAQYPALAQMNWSAPDMGGGSGMEDDLSGRSSFDASDYDEPDETGYVSGQGTGFGEGSAQPAFGDYGYGSDYGGR